MQIENVIKTRKYNYEPRPNNKNSLKYCDMLIVIEMPIFAHYQFPFLEFKNRKNTMTDKNAIFLTNLPYY